MQQVLLTIPEFAKVTGLSYKLATHLVIAGEIPSLQVGKRRRVPQRCVNEWLESARATRIEAPSALALQ